MPRNRADAVKQQLQLPRPSQRAPENANRSRIVDRRPHRSQLCPFPLPPACELTFGPTFKYKASPSTGPPAGRSLQLLNTNSSRCAKCVRCGAAAERNVQQVAPKSSCVITESRLQRPAVVIPQLQQLRHLQTRAVREEDLHAFFRLLRQRNLALSRSPPRTRRISRLQLQQLAAERMQPR
jgi:hypothetical protein